MNIGDQAELCIALAEITEAEAIGYGWDEGDEIDFPKDVWIMKTGKSIKLVDMKTGKSIKLVDMKTSHLNNTINMLIRKSKQGHYMFDYLQDELNKRKDIS